jgi:hypothetical protein
MPLVGASTESFSRYPDALCLACLAAAETVTELKVRSAAQIAVIRDGLRVLRRVCYRCGRVDDMLVTKEDSD